MTVSCRATNRWQYFGALLRGNPLKNEQGRFGLPSAMDPSVNALSQPAVLGGFLRQLPRSLPSASGKAAPQKQSDPESPAGASPFPTLLAGLVEERAPKSQWSATGNPLPEVPQQAEAVSSGPVPEEVEPSGDLPFTLTAGPDLSSPATHPRQTALHETVEDAVPTTWNARSTRPARRDSEHLVAGGVPTVSSSSVVSASLATVGNIPGLPAAEFSRQQAATTTTSTEHAGELGGGAPAEHSETPPAHSWRGFELPGGAVEGHGQSHPPVQKPGGYPQPSQPDRRPDFQDEPRKTPVPKLATQASQASAIDTSTELIPAPVAQPEARLAVGELASPEAAPPEAVNARPARLHSGVSAANDEATSWPLKLRSSVGAATPAPVDASPDSLPVLAATDSATSPLNLQPFAAAVQGGSPHTSTSNRAGFTPTTSNSQVPEGRPKRNVAPMPGQLPDDPAVSSIPSVYAPVEAHMPETPSVAHPPSRTAGPAENVPLRAAAALHTTGNTPSEGRSTRRYDDSRVVSGTEVQDDPSADTSSRTIATAANQDQSEATEFAFGGRLAPIVTADAPRQTVRSDQRSDVAEKPTGPAGAASPPESPSSMPEQAVTAVKAPSKANQQEWKGQTGSAIDEDGTARERKLQTGGSTDGDPDMAAGRTAFGPPRLPQDGPAPVAAPPRTSPAPPVSPPDPVESAPPKAGAANHDIKLEVSNGDQRVELHLVEHGGDVHVAVRTPDTHLAGELRENLPTLSSRLEQTGLRAAEWHTSTPVGGEWHRQVEHSAGAGSSDANGQSGQDTGQREGDREQHPPKTPEEQPNRKTKGKEFAWFMSTLR